MPFLSLSSQICLNQIRSVKNKHSLYTIFHPRKTVPAICVGPEILTWWENGSGRSRKDNHFPDPTLSLARGWPRISLWEETSAKLAISGQASEIILALVIVLSWCTKLLFPGWYLGTDYYSFGKVSLGDNWDCSLFKGRNIWGEFHWEAHCDTEKGGGVLNGHWSKLEHWIGINALLDCPIQLYCGLWRTFL